MGTLRPTLGDGSGDHGEKLLRITCPSCDHVVVYTGPSTELRFEARGNHSSLTSVSANHSPITGTSGATGAWHARGPRTQAQPKSRSLRSPGLAPLSPRYSSRSLGSAQATQSPSVTCVSSQRTALAA